ncbi:MAG TPA: integration host factor subunit alpha, partial [Rhizobium sp.]|nr:integration host factor subunit alpha [Rhizobium sp.]
PRRVMTFKASNVLKQRILRAHLSRKAKQKPQNPAS